MYSLFALLALPAVFASLLSDRSPQNVEYRRSSSAGPMKRAANDVQHAELVPVVHPELDQSLLDHLLPSKAAPLFWSHDGTLEFSAAPLTAKLDANFNFLGVILDHSTYIASVQCAPDSMAIQFNNATAFSHAKDQWSKVSEMVFVSSASGCHTTHSGHYGFFNTSGSSIIYDQKKLIAISKGQQISIGQAISEFSIAWEHYEAKSSTTSTPAYISTTMLSTAYMSTRSSPAPFSTSLSPDGLTAYVYVCDPDLATEYPAAPTGHSGSFSGLGNSNHYMTQSQGIPTGDSGNYDGQGHASPSATQNPGASNGDSGNYGGQSNSSPSATPGASNGGSGNYGGQSNSSPSATLNPGASNGGSGNYGGQSNAYQTPSGINSPAYSTGQAYVTSLGGTSRLSGNYSSTLSGSHSSGSLISSSSPSSTADLSYSTTSSIPGAVSSSNPETTAGCGARPSLIPSRLSQLNTSIACGPNFDQNLDSAMGFIVDASDLDTALAAYMPGVSGLTTADYNADMGSGTSKIRRWQHKRSTSHTKRGWFSDACNWVDDHIVKPVVKAVEYVANKAVDAVEYAAKKAEEWAHEAVDLMKEAAQLLLPTFNPSISFTIPIDIEAPAWMLDDSPWGDAYKIYQYTMDGGDVNYGITADSLAKLTGADELIKIEINGVEEKPEPGVQVYCVDCSITGSLKTRGSATYTLAIGFTDLQVSFNGDVHAQFQLGVNAYAEYTWDIKEVRILEVGIPGFFIPDVIVVGPMLTLGVDAEIKIEALGQLLAGARYDFNHIGATIDFFDHSKSSSHGTLPQVSTVFEAAGEVNLTASVGVPLGIGLGIDVLDGAWSKEVAIIDRPALEAVTTFKFSEDIATNCNESGTACNSTTDISVNDGTCNGIAWYVDFVNEVTLDLLDTKYDIGTWHGPKLVEGCVGHVPKSSNTTGPTTSSPATGITPINTGGASSGSDLSPHGCPLQDNAVQNSGFELGGKYPTGWTLFDYQNVVTDWGTSVDSAATSPPLSLYIQRKNGQDGRFGIRTPVTLCTDTSYDILYQGRFSNGDAVCYTRGGYVGSGSFGSQDMNPFYVVTAGKNYMQQEGPWSFTVPSKNTQTICRSSNWRQLVCFQPSATCTCQDVPLDNGITWSADNSRVTTTLTIEFECMYGTYAEIRVDDVMIVPTAYNSKKKRDISGTNLETITSAPAAVQTAALKKRTATFNPVSTTSDAAAADITNAATSIGAADYSFAPFASMLVNATKVATSAAAVATGNASALSPTGNYVSLHDTTGLVQLAAHDDGNLYLTSYPGVLPGTSFLSTSSIITNDEQGRSFHYYPATMGAYNVSRIRMSSTAKAPNGAQLLTLVPVTSGVGTIYTAMDTQGNTFLLAWCNALGYSGAKVFLMQAGADGPTILKSREVQWVVTGDEVSQCAPLLLTSGEKPII